MNDIQEDIISVEKEKALGMSEMNLFKEMIMRYGIFSVGDARKILGNIKGKLSDTVMELREKIAESKGLKPINPEEIM